MGGSGTGPEGSSELMRTGGGREGAGRTSYESALIFLEKEVEKATVERGFCTRGPQLPVAVCPPHSLESSLLPWEVAGVITPTDKLQREGK